MMHLSQPLCRSRHLLMECKLQEISETAIDLVVVVVMEMMMVT